MYLMKCLSLAMILGSASAYAQNGDFFRAFEGKIETNDHRFKSLSLLVNTDELNVKVNEGNQTCLSKIDLESNLLPLCSGSYLEVSAEGLLLNEKVKMINANLLSSKRHDSILLGQARLVLSYEQQGIHENGIDE